MHYEPARVKEGTPLVSQGMQAGGTLRRTRLGLSLLFAAILSITVAAPAVAGVSARGAKSYSQLRDAAQEILTSLPSGWSGSRGGAPGDTESDVAYEYRNAARDLSRLARSAKKKPAKELREMARIVKAASRCIERSDPTAYLGVTALECSGQWQDLIFVVNGAPWNLTLMHDS